MVIVHLPDTYLSLSGIIIRAFSDMSIAIS